MSRKIDFELPKAVSRFEQIMKQRLLIRTIFYKKVFGGKGLEFDSYRLYNPETDDSQLIDWKATMKNPSRILVRQYVEERDLKLFFIIDIGENMVFGSDNLKAKVVAQFAASLSHLVLSSGDSVGFAIFSDKILKMALPGGGIEQYYSLARELQNPNNYGGKSNLGRALRLIVPNLKGISAVFLLTDFINLDTQALKMLKILASEQETVGLMIRDRVDNELPKLSREVVIEDIYTGEQKVINPSLIREQYRLKSLEQKNQIYELFRRTGSDIKEFTTDQDYLVSLADFLRMRIKRRKVSKR
jgi:uncharacterized protein (DUF58 family)